MNIKMFSDLVPDVRNAKNKRYNVEEIVFIAMVSVLCGAETWEEIEMFGKYNESYFKERIPTLKGIPSHDTFNNFFKILDIGWFEECFRIWVDEICSRIPGVVAIDGKAVCRTQKYEKTA